MNFTKMLAQLLEHEDEWALYFDEGEYCLASDKVHTIPVVVAHNEIEKLIRLLWLHYYGADVYHIDFSEFSIIEGEDEEGQVI